MLATDFYALIGLDLALCAVFLRATRWVIRAPASGKASAWLLWLSAILLIGLWLPYGDAGLPFLAFARGIFSDLSVTSVALAVLYIVCRTAGVLCVQGRETRTLHIGLTFAALLLYPTALGWGDWDAYRLGWGSPGFVVMLSLSALACFCMGFRLLPLLVAAALMAWSFGVLESTNLWDYLIDPWIACVSLGAALKVGFGCFRRQIL